MNRPKDTNQLGKLIVDLAVGNETESPYAEERGDRGSGGRARAASLSPERRSEIARKAAKKRWGTDG